MFENHTLSYNLILLYWDNIIKLMFGYFKQKLNDILFHYGYRKSNKQISLTECCLLYYGYVKRNSCYINGYIDGMNKIKFNELERDLEDYNMIRKGFVRFRYIVNQEKYKELKSNKELLNNILSKFL